MINLIDLSKCFLTKKGKVEVFEKINISLSPGVNVGFLGGEGSGKTTLLRLLCGLEKPSSGRVETDCIVSWLIDASVVQASLSPADNVRFVCRIYGDTIELERSRLDFVRSFLGLSEVVLKTPIKKCPANVKIRLALAMVFAFDFDYYLLDDGFSFGGDVSFKRKVKSFIKNKMNGSCLIIASRDVADIKELCDAVVVLGKEGLTFYSSVEEGIKAYRGVDSVGSSLD